MKKLISLLLCVLLLVVAGTALADYNPGDTVTVTVSITSSSQPAGMITVKASNPSVLIFKGSSKSMAECTFAPQKDGAAFTLMSLDYSSNLPTGTVGTVTYKIADDAPAGKYTISVSGSGVSASGSTTVTVACKEHKWDAGVTEYEPTCQRVGKTKYTCTACGENMFTDIDIVPHDANVIQVLKEATCTEPGAQAAYCSMCNTQQGDREVIPALGHSNGEAEVSKQPTCTETGLQSYTCTVCGTKIDGETIPALGHDEVVVPGKKPTCTEKGLTDGKYCARCEVELTAQTEIAALGHTETPDAAVAPTCTKTGLTAGVHCSVCDAVIKAQEKIPALGHTEVIIPGTAATCTKEGLSDGKKCSVCGEEIQKQTKIEKLPHTPSADAVIVNPTCTKDGSATYTCTVCGESVSGKVLPATGHAWDKGTVTKMPTCSKTGVMTYVCQNDSTHTTTETIAKTGEHIWDEGTVTKAPTCTADGKVTYTCTYECGKTKTETIKKLGHDYDEGVVTKAPTCEKAGTKTFTCKNDPKHTKTETIAKLGHNYDEGVIVTEATCDTAGSKVYTCQNDASHTKKETIKKLGHNWGEWVITKPATEEEKGEKERTCSRCAKVETAVISNRQDYVMTVCTMGIRFRDLPKPITDYWYMFTPIDISVDGVQTFDLVAGNMHIIGTATVIVKEGTVTVDYDLVNKADISLYEEFMTILPNLEAAGKLDFDKLTNYEFGKPISIEEDLGGDTNVLLLVRNRAMYQEGIYGVDSFNKNSKDYKQLVEDLKLMMD